jgi:hypothetical protein
MSSITTRATSGTGATVKGAPLTNAEIDNNFIALNSDKVETADTTELNTGNKVVKRDSNGAFAAGNITVTSLTAGTISETSSIALKQNVNPITNALPSVLSLSGVTYDRKDGTSKNEAGLIAEDVFNILPNLVTLNKEGKPEGINYTKLTAYLIEAVKELKNELDSLKGKK